MDVNAGGIEIQCARRQHGDHSESFIDLPQIDVRSRPACFGQNLFCRADGREREILRRQAVSGMRHDAGTRLEAMACRGIFASKQQGAGAIRDQTAVAFGEPL